MTDFEEIWKLVKNGKKEVAIVDGRSPGRFSGLEPEPRKEVWSGNIEGSTNLFFKDILTENLTLKNS